MFVAVFEASFCNLSTKRRTKKTETNSAARRCVAARKENESRTNPTARMAAHHSSITYEDGSLYEGTLHPQSGLPHGEGMMKFSDGSAGRLRESIAKRRMCV